MADFLLEIGTEEMPAGYIPPALEALRESFTRVLAAEGLGFKRVATTATPRRLILFAEALPEKTRERTKRKSGPTTGAGRNPDGSASAAAVGFAGSQNVPLEKLFVPKEYRGKTRDFYIFDIGQFDPLGAEIPEFDDKKDRLTAEKSIPPKNTREILAEALPGIIASIPFPKSMYWRDPSFRFARPVRRILALFGRELVEFEVGGVASGRVTVGHPFVAPEPVELAEADLDALTAILSQRFVMADRKERRAKILDELQQALSIHGGELREEELLDEVTDLLEWPEVLEGSFDEDYLVLPEEVVATAMTEHQRYFPVRDGSGHLVNRFLTVANRPREYCDGIREGNERVLAARLYDARFFWDADLEKPLEEFAKRLDGVVYLAGLGTVADKSARISELAGWAAAAAGLDEHASAATQAAALSKADLVTEMVGEFPTLQGVMGRAYALAQGKSSEVAAAIEEHYMPRTLSGALPQTPAGRLAALADKADTLAGAFFMGLVPSGSQDPYGLRRASVGILRIVVESGMTLSLAGLLKKAWDLVSRDAGAEPLACFDDLVGFVRERLYQYYLDKGFRHDILRACLSAGFDDLADFDKRLSAVTALSQEDFWDDLVTAVERTYNITKGYQGPLEFSKGLFTDAAERRLADVLSLQGAEIQALIDKREYAAASRAYARAFAEPLHTFFDEVYVNVDDEKVRANRLALIKTINLLYSSRVADLAEIVRE